MLIDLLEPRQLLSVSFNSTTGTLTVVGTDNVDSIVFSEEIKHPTKQNVLRLHFNGQTSDYTESAVKLIRVNAMAGLDALTRLNCTDSPAGAEKFHWSAAYGEPNWPFSI